MSSLLFSTKAKLLFLFLVSEQFGERTINKSASQPFIGANQPTSRLGWNSEITGQAKAKQEEVRLW